jgi:hypothetical protein
MLIFSVDVRENHVCGVEVVSIAQREGREHMCFTTCQLRGDKLSEHPKERLRV